MNNNNILGYHRKYFAVFKNVKACQDVHNVRYVLNWLYTVLEYLELKEAKNKLKGKNGKIVAKSHNR